MQNGLAESVNRGRREIVEPRGCARKGCALGVRQPPVRENRLDKCWYVVQQQCIYRVFDAARELAGGEFGERDRGNFARFVAIREHHSDPTRHQRGLACARSGLNQQQRCKIGHGSSAIVLIGESHVDALQSLLSV